MYYSEEGSWVMYRWSYERNGSAALRPRFRAVYSADLHTKSGGPHERFEGQCIRAIKIHRKLLLSAYTHIINRLDRWIHL